MFSFELNSVGEGSVFFLFLQIYFSIQDCLLLIKNMYFCMNQLNNKSYGFLG